MTEYSFKIRNYSDCKIRVEETKIRAEGGPEYPRLIIPVRLDLNPIKGQQGKEQRFVILNVQGSLFLQDHTFKIADAIPNFNFYKVSYPPVSITYTIEFPLDSYRIKKIEEKRKGNMKLKLDLRFLFGLYKSMVVEKQDTKDFLTEFESIVVQINFNVFKSHWVEKLLPSFGYGKFKIVEVPIAASIIGEEFSKSLEELVHAQKYFNIGDYDKAVEHCRTAIEPIKDKLPQFKSMIESNTEYEWVKDVGLSTYNWLDKIYKKTRNLTSKPHHLPSVGHFSRYDAEIIMLVVTALIAYVGRISTSNE
ncbi:MAG: hypothetical protein ACE5K0_01390 [Candidatus Methanofastidiosia archaeon]